MSTTTIRKCDICKEVIPTCTDRFGVVFRSHKSGDFTLGHVSKTEGSHICNPCATTLHFEVDRLIRDEEITP